MWMRGESKIVDGTLGYTESLYDAHQGNRLVVYSEAQCTSQPPQIMPPKTYEAYVPPQQASVPPAIVYNPEAKQASTGLTVPLTGDGRGWHTIDVTLGTSTPAIMLLDTGATMVSLPQDIADQLIDIGEAVVITQGDFTIADGTTSTKNIIDIGKFTIGSKTIYHVRASVNPVGAPLLLGTNVLNRLGKYSIDATNHQLILG
jgi:predicted aspartyl protease